jgi:hypothetical protein
VVDVPPDAAALGDQDLDKCLIVFADMKRTAPPGMRSRVDIERTELAPQNSAGFVEDIMAIGSLKQGPQMKLLLRQATRSLQLQTARDLFGSSLEIEQDDDMSDFDGQDSLLQELQGLIRDAQRLVLDPVPISKSPASAKGAISHTIKVPRIIMPLITGPRRCTLQLIASRSRATIKEVSGPQSDPALFEISSNTVEAIDCAREMIFQAAERCVCSMHLRRCAHLAPFSLNQRIAPAPSARSSLLPSKTQVHVFIDWSNINIGAKQSMLRAR